MWAALIPAFRDASGRVRGAGHQRWSKSRRSLNLLGIFYIGYGVNN